MEPLKSNRGFEPAQYMSLSQDHLVALALWYLTEEGRQGSFENFVAEAYLYIPGEIPVRRLPAVAERARGG